MITIDKIGAVITLIISFQGYLLLHFALKGMKLSTIFFNPIINYRRWAKLSWFGVYFITIIINIIFLPYSLIYWIYKLFTYGR